MDEVPNSEFATLLFFSNSLFLLCGSFVSCPNLVPSRSANKFLAGCTTSSDALYFFSPIIRKKGEETHDIIVEMATFLASISQADVLWIVFGWWIVKER
jgi:hypothetical protein